MISWRNHLWRTSFHVIYIYKEEIYVRIPAWNSNLAVKIHISQFAPEFRDHIEVNDRFYGMAALGAESYSNLNISINEKPSEYKETKPLSA
jgi:hypothetical protein